MKTKKITSNIVTLENTDTMLLCNTQSSVIAVMLGKSSGYMGEYTIKKDSLLNNHVVIYPSAGETIDGQEAVYLYLKDEYKTITPINGGWSVVDSSNTDRWLDLSYPATLTRIGANSKPDFDFTNIGLLFPQNDATEIAYQLIIFNHNWKQGSMIYPHVHYRQTANAQPVFKMDYKWYDNGGVVPANFTTYTMNTNVFTYSSGTLAQIATNANGIDGTGKKIASTILAKIYRDDNVYTGDCLVDQFDIHINTDDSGSYGEYAK